jgi:hypothetical protein
VTDHSRGWSGRSSVAALRRLSNAYRNAVSEVSMKTAAIVFGALMLGAGIAGYIPALTPDGRLLGLFAVDGVHNLVHIATGAAAIACGMASWLAARRFFQVFAVVYGLVALLGFFVGEGQLLGIMAHNMADAWLHVIITAFAAYMGFAHRDMPVARGPGLGAA